ncbi:MAG: HAMP domain-containing sensor histidine kinase [Pseudomonadota bacterium]
MRKLYVKIVAAFWLAMALGAVGALLAARLLQPDHASAFRKPPWDAVADALAAQASRELAPGDDAALIAWAEARQSPFMRVGFYNASDTQIESVETPPATRTWSRDRFTAVERRPIRIGDQAYTLELKGQRPTGWQRSVAMMAMQPGFLALAVVLAMLLSLLLSIVIARYLVAPLRTLALTGRRLGFGDLEARASPALQHRRDEIAEFAMAFDQMAERIQKLVGAHKMLLRDISHELRSPLARVQAAACLARQQADGTTDGEFDRIELEIARLDTLVGRLLTFSRLDASDPMLDRATVDLADVVDAVARDAAADARARGCRVTVRNYRRAMVNGDGALLGSALENVVGNAVRFAPRGTEVEIEVQPTGRGYEVSIRDYGPGVAGDQLDRIFDPFVRLGPTTSRPLGSGVGLAIARSAIEAHGGVIAAQNNADAGLRVRMVLPAADLAPLTQEADGEFQVVSLPGSRQRAGLTRP